MVLKQVFQEIKDLSLNRPHIREICTNLSLWLINESSSILKFNT